MGFSTFHFSVFVVTASVFVTLHLPRTSLAAKKGGAPAPPAPPAAKGKSPGGPPKEPKPVPGLEFLGYYDGPYALFVGKEKLKQEDAWKLCQSMEHYGYPAAALFVVDAQNEAGMKGAFKLLDEKRPKEQAFWIQNYLEKDGNGETMIVVGRDGSRREVDVTGRGLWAARKRRNLVGPEPTYARLFLVSRSKRDTESVLESPAGGGEMNKITVTETHYPWLPSWQKDTAGCAIEGCEPRNCRITTPNCTIKTNDCKVGAPECELVPTAPCTAICEHCELTQPDCWQAATNCTLVEDRICTVTPPECDVVTPPCTVNRPPCVSQQPGCYLETVNKTCNVSRKCAEQLNGKCIDQPRPCGPNETPTLPSGHCTKRVCDELLICLTPTVCRQDVMHCPYGATFCPPETVHCEAPYVNCSKPLTTCTEPVFDCPFPKIVCEEPNVNCTPARVSCPPTITKCSHPTIVCDPPEIDCPLPILDCDPPKPCKIPANPDCNKKPPNCVDGSCTCMILKRLTQANEAGDLYEHVGALCDQLVTPLCEVKTDGSK